MSPCDWVLWCPIGVAFFSSNLMPLCIRSKLFQAAPEGGGGIFPSLIPSIN